MPADLWTCVATCRECGAETARAEHVPESAKGRVEMSAPFVALCKERSHNTASDINFAPVLTWHREGGESDAR